MKNAEASNLIGTYQFVTSNRANVRSGPGFSYEVEYSLYKGDPVYVYDTRSANGRTWCNIGNGWISYRTLNGETK
ncbi:SH3 domain-containing protein [Peptoniphilus senegalensis]|uniref:SH3 domain-containing protein n=1 Tax=Peptoniphilus senegalensis TaxID=1465757 RepID=UPI00399B1B0C